MSTSHTPSSTKLRAFDREVDFLTVHDLQLEGTLDPQLHEWAAAHQRVIVSYDAKMLIGFAAQRVLNQLPMAGVVIGFDDLPVGRMVLAIIALCGSPDELRDQVLFLPL